MKELAGDAARRRLFDVVREELRRCGLRQVELAALLGVHPATVSKMLSAPRNMTVENAGRLMMSLGYWLDFNVVPLKKPSGHKIYSIYVDGDDIDLNIDTTIPNIVASAKMIDEGLGKLLLGNPASVASPFTWLTILPNKEKVDG